MCPRNRSCGEVAFNHGSVNHGLLAVRATNELAVFRFANGTLGGKLGRLPLSPPTSFAPPVAWSGDGANIIVATRRPNGDEFLVVRVDDQGRRLTEERSLRGCSAALGSNDPRMILTANRRLARVKPAIACVPATPTARATSIRTQTLVPTSSPSMTVTPPAERASATLAPPTMTPTPAAARHVVPVHLPLLLREQCVITERRVDVVLVVDASSSMLQPALTGRTKLSVAVDAAKLFLDSLHLGEGDQAGIVVFNSDARLLAPLTADRAMLDLALDSIVSAQFTRIDLGVAVARSELLGARHSQRSTAAMIVLSDGRANPVPAEVAVSEAQVAKAANVIVFTIGLGVDLDVDALRAMATKPEYFYAAPDAEALADIYRGIAFAIPCSGSAFWGGRP